MPPLDPPGSPAAQMRPLPEPMTPLHTLFEQSLLWHCEGAVQLWPMGSFGVQLLPVVAPPPVPEPILQKSPPSGQSESIMHCGGRRTSWSSCRTCRSGTASDEVQGPSPSTSPHALSVSQTPETQTRMPTALEQVETLDGDEGRGCPVGDLGLAHAERDPVGGVAPVAGHAVGVHVAAGHAEAARRVA